MTDEYSEHVNKVERRRETRRATAQPTMPKYHEESAGPLDARCGHTVSQENICQDEVPELLYC